VGYIRMLLVGTRARFHGRMPSGNGDGRRLAQARLPFSIILKGAASDPPGAFSQQICSLTGTRVRVVDHGPERLRDCTHPGMMPALSRIT
jgi:hypothetical protein